MHVPTDQEVDQLLDVRELLEGATARLAARAATPEAVAALRVAWQEGMTALESGDVTRTVAANNDFHAVVAEIAGNAVLAELAGIVGRRVRWHYRQVAPERGHESWAEHAELVSAIEAGDEDRAAALARTYPGTAARQAAHAVALLRTPADAENDRRLVQLPRDCIACLPPAR